MPWIMRTESLRLWYWLLILPALSISIGCGGAGGSPSEDRLNIKHGSTPTIDGLLSSDEWKDAESVQIRIDQDWTVEVYCKHDGSGLYLAYSNLIKDRKAAYPELLLDMTNGKGNSWNSDDWWFHASYNDCEGRGLYGAYTFGVNGSCQKEHVDWMANNFPLQGGEAVEMNIPFTKIGLSPANGRTIGIAFNVTDANTTRHFWPETARIKNPSTWAVASSTDGWR